MDKRNLWGNSRTVNKEQINGKLFLYRKLVQPELGTTFFLLL